MTEIISISRTDWESESYDPLLSPYDSCRFQPKNTQFLSYAALDAGKPIGLLIGRLIVGGYELEHLFILPSHRQQGLARKMTDQFIQAITEQQELILKAYISSDNSSLAALERLATGPGWHPPKKFLERYYQDIYTLNPSWFHHIPPLPEGFQEFPWEQLTEKEEKLIAHRGQQGAIPMTMIPVHKDKARIYSNSMGLRYEDEVVGWMITHRVADQVIRYSALYIDPRFRHKGLSIRLLVHAIRQQKQSPIQWACYELLVNGTLPSWRRFVQRRLLPYSEKATSTSLVWKKLQPD